jgi:ATP phosphoribosyltransferase
MLRIALPNKGRLSDEVRQLFDDAGLDMRGKNERSLRLSLGEAGEALFVRAQDIPEFVADGAADVGVTGWDLVSESGRNLETLLDLEFGRCKLVVAAKDDSGYGSAQDIPAGARVASAFPRLTARFFEGLGKRVDVVPMSGAVEIAPHLGVADIIVDLSSTGSTLKQNGLVELGTVLQSSARLVARPGASRAPELTEKLDALTLALTAVLRARKCRYLMANVPRAQLDKVRAVLPGLNGPTVVDIMNGGEHVAVHAVVEAGQVYRILSALKALGCEGLLVTRIERVVP